jgi:tetratricopeptide (TPR) repeat protein
VPRFPAVFVVVALARLAAAQSPADTLFRTGISSLQARKFPEAEAAFRQLYDLEPGSTRGLIGAAQVYMAQGNEDAALRLLEAEAAKPPVRPVLLVAAGDVAMRARRFDQAIAYFQRGLAAIGFSSETTFYVHRGAAAGNPVADSVNALIGPDTTPKGAAGVYLRLSEAWRQKGDDQTALSMAGNAKELAPRDPSVLWTRALLLQTGGPERDALEAYRDLLAVSPDNALALNNAAYLMAETGGDLYEALRYARRARLLEPKIGQISDTIGWISLKLGWYDDAIGIFARLVRDEPNNPAYRTHLAAVLERAPSGSPAAEELKTALKRDPSPGQEQKIRDLLNQLGGK